MKSQFIGKDWGQEKKGETKDEMVGWHHWLNGHEFEQTLGNSEGQGNLARCSPWVTKSWTRLSDWTTMGNIIAESCDKNMFCFVRNCQTFQGVPFCIPTSMRVSIASLTLYFVSVLDFLHFNRCIMVSWFNLHFFPMTCDLLICLFAICISSLLRYLLKYLVHFKIRLFIFLVEY